MTITVRRLSSGWWHVRGRGPCNWSQPPMWMCSPEVLRERAFPQASEKFLHTAGRYAEHGRKGA